MGSDESSNTPQFSAGERVRFHLRKLQRHPAYLGTKQALRVARGVVPDLWRLANYQRHQLPGAVIVGAQKAGTTQLYANLVRHPRCFGGLRKELHYFTSRAGWPLAWYQSRFPLKRRVARTKGLCLEASPSYLPSPDALRRMREALPDAAVIAILRDPVARAFSHYQHEKTRHREPRSLAEAVDRLVEWHRDKTAAELGWARRGDARPLLDYVSRGYYALQVEALLEVFPPEQVLILDAADLFHDTNAVCREVFGFLGLDAHEVHSEKVYNRGYYRETIDPATAERLREHYRPHDELLRELVGRPFGWMTAGSNEAGPLAGDAANRNSAA